MKRVLSILLLLAASTAFSQDNQPWRSYFSYSNVVDITQSASRVYAAADQAIFSKSLLTGELKTITSVDGLKAETITAIHHSTQFNRTLVGNANGLLLIVNADNTIVQRVDIIEETTVQANKKKINHIYEHEGKAYISCDFGIAVFDLAAMEFGDTFYLGPNGSEVPVRQATILNNYIYAACGENAGIRRADLNNPNLNDYNNWEIYSYGSWHFVATINNRLIAAAYSTVYEIRGQFDAVSFQNFTNDVVDLRSVSGSLIATASNNIRIYNEQLQLQTSFNIIPGETSLVRFSCATILNGKLFIGTQEKGVFATFLDNISIIENITPNGPLRSNIFALEKTPNALWAVFGGYNYYMTPDESMYGISKFTPEGWLDIAYQDIAAVRPANSFVDIIANPNNENEVYVASYHSGLLKIVDNEPIVLYDNSPSGPGQSALKSLIDPAHPLYRSIRINSLAYDRNRNLWMTNSNLIDPIKVLKPDGQWLSYNIEDITESPLADHYSRMVIDKNGTKWMATRDNGVVAFNEGLNNKFLIIGSETGNLPNTYVKALAIDNRNQLWIGTIKGLRVLRGIDRFMDENELVANPIIIMEDGLAQELMYEQTITDIVVDGANNKWLATSGAGAFLVSPDGQQTLFHFTKRNSPLPSNIINDIEIDPVTGEVFFATDKGMVSYQGTSTKAEDNLNNVYVFPNPVRPEFEGDVNISGLINKANIKITDIEGNLVYETTSEGGTILWNTRAFGKHKVASGVYMIFIASEDGTETKVKKVMIIR